MTSRSFKALLKVIWPATREDVRRAAIIAGLSGLLGLLFPAIALAQAAPALNINLGTGAGLTDRVVQLIGLMTVLSLAPSIVIMTTSFVRIIVVLSLLQAERRAQQGQHHRDPHE